MNTTATNNDLARSVPGRRGASAENLKQPCDPVVGRCDPRTDCAVAGHSPQSKDMPRLSRAYSGVAGAADIRPNAAAGIETPHGFSVLPPSDTGQRCARVVGSGSTPQGALVGKNVRGGSPDATWRPLPRARWLPDETASLCICPRRRGRLPGPGHEGHRRKRAVAGERPPQGGGIPSRGAFNQRAGRYAGLPI